MTTRIIGYFLILCAIGLLVSVLVLNNYIHVQTSIFSPRTMLSSIWQVYKTEYVEASGRVIDKQQNNITTSEGISYTLLRAVWNDDKVTFGQTYEWAKNNLQKEDALFSWLYGEKPDGSFGILTDQGGQNSASDGDVNIALALIFASKRWGIPSYLTEARPILESIWEKEVVTIAGTPYLTADDIERLSKTRVVINPSYFEPYAFRIFSQIDPDRDWMALVDSSYDLLQIATKSKLDKQNSAYLPPDWITLDRITGDIIPNEGSITTNFSFDALRVPWNIALDYEWFKDPRAKKYLDTLGVLSTNWNTNSRLYGVYTHDGTASLTSEVPAMYGGTIGYFMWNDPKSAREIYLTKLSNLYDPDTSTWRKPLSYYDDNWVWFGVSLYNHLLPNLAA